MDVGATPSRPEAFSGAQGGVGLRGRSPGGIEGLRAPKKRCFCTVDLTALDAPCSDGNGMCLACCGHLPPPPWQARLASAWRLPGHAAVVTAAAAAAPLPHAGTASGHAPASAATPEPHHRLGLQPQTQPQHQHQPFGPYQHPQQRCVTHGGLPRRPSPHHRATHGAAAGAPSQPQHLLQQGVPGTGFAAVDTAAVAPAAVAAKAPMPYDYLASSAVAVAAGQPLQLGVSGPGIAMPIGPATLLPPALPAVQQQQQQPLPMLPAPQLAPAWPSPRFGTQDNDSGITSEGSAASFAFRDSQDESSESHSFGRSPEWDEFLSDLELEEGFPSTPSRPFYSAGPLASPDAATPSGQGSYFLDGAGASLDSETFVAQAGQHRATATAAAAPLAVQWQRQQQDRLRRKQLQYCPPPFSSAELLEANTVVSGIAIPGLATYFPVHEEDCLIPLVTRNGIPPISIALGASYFQRILAKDPTMAEMVQSFGFFLSSPSAHPTKCGSLLSCPNVVNNIMMRSRLTSCPDNAWCLAVYLTCIYLAAKLADSIRYKQLLCFLLTFLFGRPMSSEEASDIELSVLKMLDWRLGPFFDLGPH